MQFYLNFGNCDFVFLEFIETYFDLLTFNLNQITCRYPGPVFPLILFFTDYSQNSTVFLSIFLLCCEIFTFYFWSKFFFLKVNNRCALFYSFIPLPLMFGYLHSPDILFFLLSSILLLYFFNFVEVRKTFFYLLVLIMILTRPSAFIILIIFLFYGILNKSKSNIFISLLFIIFCAFYYLPYFIDEMKIVDKNSNIYYSLSSHSINIIFMYVQKFIYLMGFSPSESSNLLIFLIKGACGTLFLLGYFYSFLKFNLFDFLIINAHIVLIVLFMYPAYRYLLPIMPLLYMYFYIFFDKILFKLQTSD